MATKLRPNDFRAKIWSETTGKSRNTTGYIATMEPTNDICVNAGNQQVVIPLRGLLRALKAENLI